MKISIDKNNLLVIENPNIPKTKEYCHNVSGYKFCDYDKGLIIYHKKQFKIINLKDLGEKMGVIYIKKNLIKKSGLSANASQTALKLYNGYNENTGEEYYYLYKIGNKNLSLINKIFDKLNIYSSVKYDSIKGCLVKFGTDVGYKDITNLPKFLDEKGNLGNLELFSFLFILTILYGKISINNGDLKSIKINLNLFGQYMKYQEILDEICQKINIQGIFVKKNIQETNDGIIYQITSSDYELLQIFARFYEPIEKGLKISKHTDTFKIKEKLVEFLNSNKDVPKEGKAEVLEEIENGMIKILVK